jgi:sirohydrochlorin cobaltochelatase
MIRSAFVFGTSLAVAACAAQPQSLTPPVAAPGSESALPPVVDPPVPVEDSRPVGTLVMAHGGTPEWNAMVEGAVERLRASRPTALAYGMANPYTLRAALDSLDDQGVERVAVVRMFLSGRSFEQQTHYFLGLSDRAPEAFVLMGPAASDPDARAPLSHDLEVATHADGLLPSSEAATIVESRALDLSRDPASESVLLIAHGMGDERENDEVLSVMEGMARRIETHGFASVRVETLREDWEGPRAEAEQRIRGFVADQSDEGRRVLVVPVRLAGFGPYAEVLTGLDYVAGAGLLPHDAIASWVERTSERVVCSAGWASGPDICPPATTSTVTPPLR